MDPRIVEDTFKIEHIVKRNDENSFVQYVCLYDLLYKKYAVLSANFYYRDTTIEDFHFFLMQTRDLLLDLSPRERCEWFESIEQAISQHDLEFED